MSGKRKQIAESCSFKSAETWTFNMISISHLKNLVIILLVYPRHIILEVEVTLRLTDSQSVCLSIEHPWGTCDQILFPVGMLLSEICGLASMGRPLWREDGSAIFGVITQCSESLKTRNHTFLVYYQQLYALLPRILFTSIYKMFQA
jgi:hypothetical protein